MTWKSINQEAGQKFGSHLQCHAGPGAVTQDRRAAIAPAERSRSSSVVAQFEIDTRTTYSPFQVVPPSQHVPSRWIAATAARLASYLVDCVKSQ